MQRGMHTGLARLLEQVGWTFGGHSELSAGQQPLVQNSQGRVECASCWGNL